MNNAINHISAHRIQTAGLGGMKPNTIILGWPNSWRKKEEDSWRVFVDSIRYASAAHMALLVPKGIQESCLPWPPYKGRTQYVSAGLPPSAHKILTPSQQNFF